MRLKMMNKSNFIVYSCTATIILGWWLFAFYATGHPLPPIPNPQVRIQIPNSTQWEQATLRDALLGDTVLMRQYLLLWDEENKLNQTAYLSPEELNRALQLCDFEASPTAHAERFFPQTFNAASFLLALVGKDQICSLPEGLRRHTDLYPDEICATIPSESNRHRAEILSQQNPKAAFVSNYSDPYTIEMLQQQGIAMIALEAENTLEAIQNGIISVGAVTDRMEKAELLTLFVKAAMLTIDHRANYVMGQRTGPVVFVYYQMGLQVPTSKSLTGYLLKRLKVDVAHNPIGWRLPMSEEKLIAASPESLVIITDDPSTTHSQLFLSPALAQLDAVKQGRFCYIANHIQHQSNQFIVLAYLDLVEALRI